MATAAFDGNVRDMCRRGEGSTDTPPDLSPKTDPKKEKTEGDDSSAGGSAEGSSSADGTTAGTRSAVQQDSSPVQEDSENQADRVVVSTALLNGPRPVDHPEDEVFHSDSE